MTVFIPTNQNISMKKLIALTKSDELNEQTKEIFCSE